MNTHTSKGMSGTATGAAGIIIGAVLGALLIIILTPPETPPEVPRTESDGAIISDGTNVPIAKQTEDFLREQGYSALMLVKEGKVKIVDPSGGEIRPCGFVTDGQIPPECGLVDTRIINLRELQLVRFNSSHCDAAKSGGTLVTWHTTNTSQWNPGDEPCHNSSNH